MKQVAKSLVTTAILGTALFTNAAMAAQKIGVIDVQSVFRALPQAATISETINAEFKDRIEEVSRLQKDGEYYVEKLQRDSATMSEQEKKDLQKQIIDVREKLTAKAQPLQQEIQRRRNEEQNKILALIKQAVDAVAAKDNYDVILNAGAVSFTKDEYNLSKAVLERVNKIN